MPWPGCFGFLSDGAPRGGPPVRDTFRTLPGRAPSPSNEDDGEIGGPTGRIGDIRSASGSRHVSDQPQPLEARMAFLADDDVIVHGNPERIGDADDRLRHLDIGGRRRRVA